MCEGPVLLYFGYSSIERRSSETFKQDQYRLKSSVKKNDMGEAVNN